MTGLQKLCKLYGRFTAKDEHGAKVEWVWDYANDVALHKKDMTPERFAASERAKWKQIKANSDGQEQTTTPGLQQDGRDAEAVRDVPVQRRRVQRSARRRDRTKP